MSEGEGHRLTFAEMLQKLHLGKHTGPVIVHFAQGVPNVIELPAPTTQIKLEKGDNCSHDRC